MTTKRKAPVRGSEDRRRTTRQPGRTPQRRSAEAPPRNRRPRPTDGTGRPKSAGQAKARAKARKATAPKVVRPPLRQRLVVKLASIDLNPRALAAKVPFVVLVIGALGLGLGVTLWLSTDAAERSYELSHARQTNEGLSQQKEALERDVLEAQAAPALAEAARNLGMIPSKDTAHLVQDPTGNWVVVGSPKPAEGVPPPPLNTPVVDQAPPPPPPPPAPRVVDPREVTVRVPVPTPAPAPVPPAVPLAAPAPELPPPPELPPVPPAPVEQVPVPGPAA